MGDSKIDADRQLDLECPGNARNNLRRQEGMAAQMEEIIVNADLVALENFAPDFNQQEFGRVSRRLGSFVAPLMRGSSGIGQGGAVHFAIGSQRQFRQRDDMGRHHERRKLGGEKFAQLQAGDRRAGTQDNVGDQLFGS